MALVGGSVAVVAAIALSLYAKDPGARCPSPHDAVPQALGIVFVLGCAASFLLGGALTEIHRPAHRQAGLEDALGPRRSRPRTSLQLVLVGVLAVLTLLLSYETVSLSILGKDPNSSLWPITWFVRCVSTLTPLTTVGSMVVAWMMSAFFGKWLWYRPRTG